MYVAWERPQEFGNLCIRWMLEFITWELSRRRKAEAVGVGFEWKPFPINGVVYASRRTKMGDMTYLVPNVSLFHHHACLYSEFMVGTRQI